MFMDFGQSTGKKKGFEIKYMIGGISISALLGNIFLFLFGCIGPFHNIIDVKTSSNHVFI
jgi:hypothetical protein